MEKPSFEIVRRTFARAVDSLADSWKLSLSLQRFRDPPEKNAHCEVTDTAQCETGITQPEQIGKITDDNGSRRTAEISREPP